ncbi:DU1801 protein [Dyella terrae]|nr:DU1801 protein [Dyella terrae]
MNPSERIDQLIEGIEDWRGKTLTGLRETILAADKAVIEEWKWMGSPVWSCDGMIAVANAHKEKVKITFMHGAQLEDPAGLFNAGLDGGKWRAIDWHEGDSIDKPALKALVRAAIAYNRAHLKKNAPARSRTKAEKGA